MKINEKLTLKKTCNHLVGLFSFVESVAAKRKLYSTTIN